MTAPAMPTDPHPIESEFVHGMREGVRIALAKSTELSGLRQIDYAVGAKDAADAIEQAIVAIPVADEAPAETPKAKTPKK